MALFIFLALLGVPVLEIAVFIEIGGWIGLWPTLGLIVATAMAGTALLRQQGLSTLARARETVERGKMPVREVADGVCLLVAGALLLTPGFVTDAAGGLLLVPPVRHAMLRWALARIVASGRFTVQASVRRGGGDAGDVGDIIDGTYEVVRDDDDAPPPPRELGRRR